VRSGPAARGLQRLRIDDIHEPPFGKRIDVVKGDAEIALVVVLPDVPDVRFAQHVGQCEQRMIPCHDGLLFVDVDRREPGTARAQRLLEGALGDQLRAAGVDQQRRALHPGEVVGRDQSVGVRGEPHMQISDVVKLTVPGVARAMGAE